METGKVFGYGPASLFLSIGPQINQENVGPLLFTFQKSSPVQLPVFLFVFASAVNDLQNFQKNAEQSMLHTNK